MSEYTEYLRCRAICQLKKLSCNVIFLVRAEFPKLSENEIYAIESVTPIFRNKRWVTGRVSGWFIAHHWDEIIEAVRGVEWHLLEDAAVSKRISKELMEKINYN